MGYIRFRKTISLGGLFRLNIGKRGVSLTAGRRRGGPHFTVHSDGHTTTSVGVPGTGLSYIHTTRRGRAKAWATSNRVASIIAALVILTVIVLTLLGGM